MRRSLVIDPVSTSSRNCCSAWCPATKSAWSGRRRSAGWMKRSATRSSTALMQAGLMLRMQPRRLRPLQAPRGRRRPLLPSR